MTSTSRCLKNADSNLSNAENPKKMPGKREVKIAVQCLPAMSCFSTHGSCRKTNNRKNFNLFSAEQQLRTLLRSNWNLELLGRRFLEGKW